MNGARSRAMLSLRGLSVGDALGETFFGHPEDVVPRIEARRLPTGPCGYTDDTEMAISVVEELMEHGRIDPDSLARRFAHRADWGRGYGRGARALLTAIRSGGSWRHLAPGLFEGRGSHGNGAAMRVAPLGAWFADDLDRVVEEAVLSARVTHAHPEGVAGAVAVAVAAAAAWQAAVTGDLSAGRFMRAVADRTPGGRTREGIEEASLLPGDTSPQDAARRLGVEVTAPGSVPFAVWSAARHLGDYEDAFWSTVAGLGDRDTTCAMALGVVALSSGGVPAAWEELREPISLLSLDDEP